MYRLQEEDVGPACTAAMNPMNIVHTISTTNLQNSKFYVVHYKIAKIHKEIIQLRHIRHSVLEPTTTGPIHHPRPKRTEVARTTGKTLATHREEEADPHKSTAETTAETGRLCNSRKEDQDLRLYLPSLLKKMPSQARQICSWTQRGPN